MRVALLSDVHGNAVALDATLADLPAVDRIVCLGDVAVFGPQPREALRRVRDLGCPVVMGNADHWSLHQTQTLGADAGEDERRMAEIEVWSAAQLTEDDLAFTRTFEPVVRVALDGGDLLAFHGSPRSSTEVIVATTPDDDLARMLGDARALVMAGGHTHTQMLRRFGEMLLLNPGSVGLPFELARPHRPPDDGSSLRLDRASAGVRNPPWTEYAVVEATGGALRVELRRAPADAEAVVAAALRSGMPHAAWWAAGWRA